METLSMLLLYMDYSKTFLLITMTNKFLKTFHKMFRNENRIRYNYTKWEPIQLHEYTYRQGKESDPQPF